MTCIQFTADLPHHEVEFLFDSTCLAKKDAENKTKRNVCVQLVFIKCLSEQQQPGLTPIIWMSSVGDVCSFSHSLIPVIHVI